MALKLEQKVAEFLTSRPGEPFTARQIAEHLFAAYPGECRAKKDASRALATDADLLQQLVAEIGAHRPQLQARHPRIKTTEGRPRQYYAEAPTLTPESPSFAPSRPSASDKEPSRLAEYALYPALSAYVLSEFGVYSKRINEKRSSNQRGPQGNRWLYPDIVGLEDLNQHRRPEIKECMAICADKRVKLWSFEVKCVLNRSTVREAYFQAVSNSSWANVGYLASAGIEGQDTLKELRLLYAAHGIGVIKLDPDNPAESQTLIPATERPCIDWDAADRLADENKDFLRFIKHITQFHQTQEIRPQDWDAVTADD